MSNEENKEVSSVSITPVMQPEPASQEIQRGPNGEVGKPTASLTIKQMWHEKHFRLEDAPDSRNPRKQVWVQKGKVSLKEFARELVASCNTMAQDWFAHKTGVLNEKRSDANVATAHAAASATRAEKRKKSASKQSKSKPKEEAPATVVTKQVK